MRADPTLVRSGQWWNHKIPPVIATAAIVLGAGTDVGVAALLALVAFVVTTVGIAAFGHVVNDLADIHTDELAGAPNRMAPLSGWSRSAVLAATIATGALPWIWLPHGSAVLVLLGTEVLLLIVYSVRPIRLKDRAAAGVCADALYAYVVPILLTGVTFAEIGGVDRPPWYVTASVTSWMLLMGLRGILWHQIGDLAHDRRAGVRTLATKVGAEGATRFLGWAVLVELAAAAATMVSIAITDGRWWLPCFGASYLLYRAFQVTMMWTAPLHVTTLKHANGRIRFIGFVLLNELVERWLPVAALLALATNSPVMWVALVCHLVLFDNAVVRFVRDDFRHLPHAVDRFAFEPQARRSIRKVAEDRRRAIARGPAPVTEEARRSWRWLFVVCGSDLHISTLATAVRHLRPLTTLEIWVLTDSTRNVRPIDLDGIHLVDVRTPSHFDDHQASIWLKTGAHRHLPAGEWCYLDSDIVAVRPGIEEVFDRPRGPVMFASDLMITANRVDRFSPWAMTCECSGMGDTHSCSHLREQLLTRFGVEVPPDWVHWNGGVFRFGTDSSEFLDMWNSRAVASFDWPEWRTRDQGTLIATVWTLGLQDAPRLPPEFNFIVDLGNSELSLDPLRGWAVHPDGPWHEVSLLHLYTSRLEDPDWDLGRDVEAPVIRQTLGRTRGWSQVKAWYWATRKDLVGRRIRFGMAVRKDYWAVRTRFGIYWLRMKRIPTRIRPDRVRSSLSRRLRRDGHDLL